MQFFRVLNVVEEVAQFIPIPQNQTTTSIQLDRFAVAVMELAQSDEFTGQDFSVDLGQRFNSEPDLVLKPGDIKFEMDEAATASLSISSDFFETPSVSDAISSSSSEDTNSTEGVTSRIVNSVFLTDTLFPRINSSGSNVTTAPVGSIILSSTLTVISINQTKIVRVVDLKPPITLTFVKKQSLANDSVTTCNFWDFEENGQK